MKKILLLVAAVLFTGVTVNAEKRTKSQILSAAAEVLQTKCPRTSNMSQKAELMILDNSFPQFSIVGYQSGSYVIVANDDAMPAIIGYSDSKFDLRNTAPAFLWYLNLANKNIEECLANGTKLPMTKINPNFKEEVPMLCQTKWGQDDPYFRMTPINEENDQNYVTGCVATAMSQAMKYYEFPEVGRGKVKYTSTPVEGNGTPSSVRFNMNEQVFDWDNMLNEYTKYKFNSDEADAVAYLMKCTGGSVKMIYGASGSGAFTTDVPAALHKYFYYDRSIDCYHGDHMTKDEWCELAYGNLSKGYPLIFGASSSIGGQDAGHSFVVDGYDKAGLVHVNFGWNGDADGYYNLFNMHGYDHALELIPLMKPQTDSQIKSVWAQYQDNLTYNQRGDVNVRILNVSSRDFTGRIGVILKNLADGTEQLLDFMDYKDEGYTRDGGYLNLKDFVATAPIPEGTPDGEYRLYLGSKGAWTVKIDPSDKHSEEELVEENSWQPIRCADGYINSMLITITNGKADIKPEKNAAWVLGIDNVITKNFTSDLVRVYDVEGRMIYSSKASDFQISDVPANGMLIIKTGSDVRKVIK